MVLAALIEVYSLKVTDILAVLFFGWFEGVVGDAPI
jgi:hypothetical protein